MIFEQIGREFASAVLQKHPEAGSLIEAGWDPSFDVDVDLPSDDVGNIPF